jgi:Arc/MetJ-type ribon-helix-helix transcriptional regulator
MISRVPSPVRTDLPVRLPISFTDDLYDWLREAAFRRRVSMAELVRQALREYRERHDPQLDLPIRGEQG